MKKRRIYNIGWKLSGFVFLMIGLFFIQTTWASNGKCLPPDIALQVPLGPIDCVPGLGTFLQQVYQISVSLAGMAAVVMIVYGGFKWITAGGDASAVGKAKEYISSAIFGLGLLLGTYAILALINPQLLRLGISIQPVEAPPAPPTTEKPSGTPQTQPKTDQAGCRSQTSCDASQGMYPAANPNLCANVPSGQTCCCPRDINNLGTKSFCCIIRYGYDGSRRPDDTCSVETIEDSSIAIAKATTACNGRTTGTNAEAEFKQGNTCFMGKPPGKPNASYNFAYCR